MQVNPKGPEKGGSQICRGGGLYYTAKELCAGRRNCRLTGWEEDMIGFRIVMGVKKNAGYC